MNGLSVWGCLCYHWATGTQLWFPLVLHDKSLLCHLSQQFVLTELLYYKSSTASYTDSVIPLSVRGRSDVFSWSVWSCGTVGQMYSVWETHLMLLCALTVDIFGLRHFNMDENLFSTSESREWNFIGALWGSVSVLLCDKINPLFKRS